MDSKCFKQIKQIFAEVICANPCSPVNQVVKDKDKSTLFVPCTCQVVKSVLCPLWPVLFQGAAGSHCEVPHPGFHQNFVHGSWLEVSQAYLMARKAEHLEKTTPPQREQANTTQNWGLNPGVVLRRCHITAPLFHSFSSLLRVTWRGS